jgi:DNA replication protein DnaC
VKQLSEVLSRGLLRRSESAHRQRVEEIERAGARLDQTVQFMPEPCVARAKNFFCLIPKTTTIRELVDNTTELDTIEASARLALCKRCPRSGGLCAGEERPGKQPQWTKRRPEVDRPGIVWITCERWPGYALDMRMLGSGFPKKLLRCSVDGWIASSEQRREDRRRAKEQAESVRKELGLERHESVPRERIPLKTQKRVKRYLQKFYRAAAKGKGLGFYGSTGTGKTHLAVAVCRHLLQQKLIPSARFWDTAALLTTLRQSDDARRQQVLEEAQRVAILVLDDVGAHNTTPWVREQLGMIINHRWSAKLPVFVTSNTTLNHFIESLGQRTVSRLVDCTMSLELLGEDERTKEVARRPTKKKTGTRAKTTAKPKTGAKPKRKRAARRK